MLRALKLLNGYFFWLAHFSKDIMKHTISMRW